MDVQRPSAFAALVALAEAALANPSASFGALCRWASAEAALLPEPVNACVPDAASLQGLPQPLRAVAGEALCNVLFGEIGALLCAWRSAQRLDGDGASNDWERMAMRRQANDEMRHICWFAATLEALAEPPQVRTSVAALVQQICAAEQLEAWLVGMNVFVESTAHLLFLEARQILPIDLPPLFIVKDEARHIALGSRLLKARWPRLQASERQSLQRQAQTWSAMIRECTDDPDILRGLGWGDGNVSEPLMRILQNRLRRVGLPEDFVQPDGQAAP